MTRGKFQGKETSNNEQPMGAGRFKVKGSRLKEKAAGFGGGIRFGEIRRSQPAATVAIAAPRPPCKKLANKWLGGRASGRLTWGARIG